LESRRIRRIRFQYRALHDVVIAYVAGTLATESDIAALYEEFETYFTTRFPGRKKDLIIELSKFHFSARIADSFGRFRDSVLRNFTVRCYRVKQSMHQRSFMYTRSVLSGTPANDYPSVDDALNALLDDRRRR